MKLAFRRLARTPFVSIIAIVSLALGSGANAAIFSLFDQLLRRSLPVQDPGDLVNLTAPGSRLVDRHAGLHAHVAAKGEAGAEPDVRRDGCTPSTGKYDPDTGRGVSS